MGEKRPVFTKLYAPDGTLVEVEGEERATLLKEQRGYTTSKPRNPTKPQGNSADAELERLKAENEALKARAEAAEQAAAEKPAK